MLTNTDFMNDFADQDFSNRVTDIPIDEAWSLGKSPEKHQTANTLPLADLLHVPMHPSTPNNCLSHLNGSAINTTGNGGIELEDVGLTTPPSEALHAPDKNALIEVRMAYALEGAKAAGFQSFEESIVAYYTTCFDKMTSLYDQQRRSRGRRLPQLLAAWCNAARGWSDWERKGFQEEILQGTEDILAEELKAFKAVTNTSKWFGMTQDKGAANSDSGNDKRSEIKQNVQNEVSYTSRRPDSALFVVTCIR